MDWTDFRLYFRFALALLLLAGMGLLAGCSCDDCKENLKKSKNEFKHCVVKRDDFEQQKTACAEQLALVTGGDVLSYSCAGTTTLAIDPATAQITTTCDDNTAVEVTPGAVVAPDGMAIQLPNTAVDHPGGGGVVFPGGGGVVFPGGGGVVFPGGGGVVFSPDGEQAETTDVTDDIKAWDVFEYPAKNLSNNDDSDGYLVLPGGKTRFRCVQDPTTDNLRLYQLEHNSTSGNYTIRCNKPAASNGTVQSTLITGM